MQSYQSWIQFLFARDNSGNDWRMSDSVFDVVYPPLDVLQFTEKMFDNFESDLNKYTDAQLSYGLEFILNPSFSDYPFVYANSDCSLSLRCKSLDSFFKLYSKCFQHRCQQSYGHLSEEGNALNSLCYMLWDYFPILTQYSSKSEEQAIIESVIDMLSKVISLEHPSCIESALHGLGHLTNKSKRAKTVIEGSIKSPQMSKKLLPYAIRARNGNIV